MILLNMRHLSSTMRSICSRAKWIEIPIARQTAVDVLCYRFCQRQSTGKAVYRQKVMESNCPPRWLGTVAFITEYRFHLQHREAPQAWGETWHFLLPAGFCFVKPGRTSVKVGCLHGRPRKMPRRVIYAPFSETIEEIHWEFSNERSGQWNIFITVFSKTKDKGRIIISRTDKLLLRVAL